MSDGSRSHVLFIGGRSGVGKSTAALALHEQLTQAGICHAVVEGDYMDLAFPPPRTSGRDVAALNLRAIWHNYRALGYRRLVYTNTTSIVATDRLVAAMEDDPIVTRVLLRSSDEVASERLRLRALGAPVDAVLGHSATTAAWLDEAAAQDVIRLDTDTSRPEEVARALATTAGWL